jgi:hypothetical protein
MIDGPLFDMGVHDEALEVLDGVAAAWLGGVADVAANDGPIVAESLQRLGASDRVIAWSTAAAAGVDAWPDATDVISLVSWHMALGRRETVRDWLEFFDIELRLGEWDEVVAQWAPQLMAGCSGAAFHGVIRTAHAVRAIGDDDSQAALTEIGAGLATWAAAFRPLPGGPNAHLVTTDDPIAGLGVVPRFGELIDAGEISERPGSIDDRLDALRASRMFGIASGALDPTGSPREMLTVLRRAASLIAAEPTDEPTDETFDETFDPAERSVRDRCAATAILLVDAVAALIAYLPPWALAATIGWTWQGLAALQCAGGPAWIDGPVSHLGQWVDEANDAEPSGQSVPDELIARAAASDDALIIKVAAALTDAMLRDDHPVHRRAAQRLLGSLLGGVT